MFLYLLLEGVFMTSLYFIRHAHSIYTSDEIGRPLSSQGLDDATKVIHLLAKEPVDFVISSPYKRAIQTVEGIAERIEQDVQIETDFRERLLTVKPVEDFQEAITKVWRYPSFSYPGGESNIVARQRGVNRTLKLLEEYKGKSIVIGTHGNLMVLVMQYFDQRFDFSFWQKLSMPDIYKLDFQQDRLKTVQSIWKEK